MKKQFLLSFLAFPLVFLFACSGDNNEPISTPLVPSSSSSEETTDQGSGNSSSEEENVLPSHTYVHYDRVEPTCETDGHIEYYQCSECNKYFDINKKEISYSSIKLEALGHDYGEWEVTTQPTHLTPGVETRVCKHDNTHKETRAVPIGGHNFVFSKFEWSNNNTKAKAVLVCSDDNEVFKVDLTTTSRDTATCTQDGFIIYSAEYQGHDEDQVSSLSTRKGHTPLTPVIDNATKMANSCTKDGGYEEVTYCKDCGVEIARSLHFDAACGHHWSDEWIIDEPASCDHDGHKHRVCLNDCNDIQEEIIPALGHNLSSHAVPATCTQKGYTIYECSRCNYSYKVFSNESEPLGHTVTALCTTISDKCERCGYQYKPVGHDYQIKSSTAATCINKGYTVYECSHCHEEDIYYTSEPLGHLYDEDHMEVSTRLGMPACFKQKTYTCTRDGCSQPKIVEYEAHSYVYSDELSKEATCTEPGQKVYVCSVCTDAHDNHTKIVPTPKDTNNHNWDEGIEVAGVRHYTCSSCGAYRDVTVLTESVNADTLKNKEITVENASSIKIDNSVIDKIISDNPDKDVKLNISVDTVTQSEAGLTDDEMLQVGSGNQIYDFTLSKTVDSVTTPENSFNGNITITLPYELKPGDDPDNIAVWYINKSALNPEDRLQCFHATYANRQVTFSTNHFSYYAVTTLTNAERCDFYGHDFEYHHVDGDCTHGAYDIGVCRICQAEEILNKKDPIGHNWVVDKRTDATCTSSGKIIYRCTNPNCTDTKEELLPTLGHNYHEVSRVNSTCDDEGYIHYECSTCPNKYNEILQPTGHNFEPTVIPATCESQGYTHHECSICHESYNDTFNNPIGHDWVISKESVPDCVTSHIVEYECSHDHSHTRIEVTRATGHTPSDTAISLNIVPATCLEDGSHDEVIFCTTCGEEVSRTHVIDAALGHTPGSVVRENEIEATCEEAGSHDEVIYCDRCHEELERNTVTDNALGHVYGGWVRINEPTCTETGLEERYCEHDANHIQSKTIDALGHTPGSVVYENEVSATCTEEGHHDEVIYCTVCHAELSRTTVIDQAKGHNWGDWVNVNEHATCTEARQQSHQCLDCDVIEYRDVEAATGHNVVTRKEDVVNPTCEGDGSYTLVTYCSACGEELNREENVVDPALGHQEGEVTIKNEIKPTCTQAGSHDENIYCTVCGGILSSEHVEDAALGHDWGEWYVSTAPTCGDEGILRRDCQREGCHEYEEEAIPATHNHTPGTSYVADVENEPTCTTPGTHYEAVDCKICGQTISYEQVTDPALGHTYLASALYNDDYSMATVTLTCENDHNHTVVKTVNTTADKELRCDEPQTITYSWELKYNGVTYSDSISVAGRIKDHTPGLPVEENYEAPNCLNNGGYDVVVHCEECGHIISSNHITLDPTGHTPGEVVIEDRTEATCTESGGYYEVTYCTVCGEEVEKNHYNIPHTGHLWTTSEVTTQPTCTETGVETVYCEHDHSHVSYNEIPALGHQWSQYYGYDENCHYIYCTVCGERKPGSEVEHDLLTYCYHDQHETCTEEGIYYKACRYCSYRSDNYSVDALGHLVYEDDWFIGEKQPPTCTEPGTLYKMCRRCWEVLEEREFPAKGHKYNESGICTVYGCYQRNPEVFDRTLYIEAPEGWDDIYIGCYDSEDSNKPTVYRPGFIYGEGVNGRPIYKYDLKPGYDYFKIEVPDVVSTDYFEISSTLEAANNKNLQYYITLQFDGDTFTGITASSDFLTNEYVPVVYDHYHDYSFNEYYEFDGETCEEGYTHYRECLCGYSYSEHSTYHDTTFRTIDFAKFGYEGVSIQYVDYCKACQTYTYAVSRVLEAFANENISHTVTDEALTGADAGKIKNVYVINEGEENELVIISISEHIPQENYECIKDVYELNTIYQNDEVVVKGRRDFVYSEGEHNMTEPVITFDNPELGCEGGMHYESHCTECSYDASYSTTSHSYITEKVELLNNYDVPYVMADFTYQRCEVCDAVPIREGSVRFNEHFRSTSTPLPSEQVEEGYQYAEKLTYDNCDYYIINHYNKPDETLWGSTCTYLLDNKSYVYHNDDLIATFTYSQARNLHQYGEWQYVEGFEPTCESGGYERRYCELEPQNAWEEREVAPLGHDYVDGVCSRCGHKYSDDDVTIYFNIPTDWDNVYVYATKNGEAVLGAYPGTLLTNEDKVSSYELNGIYDAYTVYKVDANKNEFDTIYFLDGDTNAIREIKNYYLSDRYNYVHFTDETEVESGTTYYDVSIGNACYYFHIHYHNDTQNYSAPTCISEGYIEDIVICDDCGSVLKSTPRYIDMIPHVYDHTEDVTINAVTCTTDGLIRHNDYCSSCKQIYHFEDEVIKALGHVHGEAVIENYKDSTCTAKGSYDSVVYCTRNNCGAEISRETIEIAMKAHTPGEHHHENEAEATYYKDGSYDDVVRCTVCGNIISSVHHVVPQLIDHYHVSIVIREDGSMADVNITFDNPETNPIYTNVATTSVTSEHTCLQPYTITYNASYTYDDIVFNADTLVINKPADGHVSGTPHEEKRVEPQCEVGGSYDLVTRCTVCKEVLSSVPQTIDATGHSWGGWLPYKDATCTEHGEEIRYCSNDNSHYETRETDLIEHNYQIVHRYIYDSKDELLFHMSYYECTGCHHIDADNYPVFIEHCEHEDYLDKYSYQEYNHDEVQAIDPNYEYGEIEQFEEYEASIAHFYNLVDTETHCIKTKNSKYVLSEKGKEPITILLTKHNVTVHENIKYKQENAYDGDCSHKSSYENVKYCEACNTELSRVTVYGEYGDHNPLEAVVENYVAPTCSKKGSYDSVVYCSICGQQLSRESIEVPMTAHTAAEPVVENRDAGDCQHQGQYDSVVYCVNCNHELSRETITTDYGPHNFTDAEIHLSYNSGKNQLSAWAECNICKEHIHEVQNEPNSVVIKEATETETGITRYTATFELFGEQSLDVEVPVLPHVHNFSTFVEHVDGTCKTQAHDVYQCSCGETENYNWGEFGDHSYVKTVNEPTCTQGGYTHYECSICHGWYNTEEVGPLGHSYNPEEVTYLWTEDNNSVTASVICSRCGEYHETSNYINEIARKDATFTEEGFVTYEAHFSTLPATTKTVDIPRKECEEHFIVEEHMHVTDKEKNVIYDVLLHMCSKCGYIKDYELTYGTQYGKVSHDVVLTTEQVKELNSIYDQGRRVTFDGTNASFVHIWKDESTSTCTYNRLGHIYLCDNEGKLYKEYDLSLYDQGSHNWGEWIIDEPATCSEDGTKHRVCSENPKHIDYGTIPATGVHTYVDGICSVCGAREPRSFLGFDKTIYILDATNSEGPLFIYAYNSQTEMDNRDYPGDYLSMKNYCGQYVMNTEGKSYQLNVYKYTLGSNYDIFNICNSSTQTEEIVLTELDQEIPYLNTGYLFVVGTQNKERLCIEYRTTNIDGYLTNPHTHSAGAEIREYEYEGDCLYDGGYYNNVYCNDENCHALLSSEPIVTSPSTHSHNYQDVTIYFAEHGMCAGTMEYRHCTSCNKDFGDGYSQEPTFGCDFYEQEPTGVVITRNGKQYNAYQAICTKCGGKIIQYYDSEGVAINTCSSLERYYVELYNKENELVVNISTERPVNNHKTVRRVFYDGNIVIYYKSCINCDEKLEVLDYYFKGESQKNTVSGEIINHHQSIVTTETYSDYVLTKTIKRTYLTDCYVSDEVNFVVKKNNEKVFETNYTETNDLHDYVHGYALLDENAGCEGGWIETYTCSKCGSSNGGEKGIGHIEKNKTFSLTRIVDGKESVYFSFPYVECDICHQLINTQGEPYYDEAVFATPTTDDVVVGTKTYHVYRLVAESENVVVEMGNADFENIDQCHQIVPSYINVTKKGERVFTKTFDINSGSHQAPERVAVFENEGHSCENGYHYEQRCSACGETIRVEPEIRYGHSWDHGHYDILDSENCNLGHIEYEYCRICGESKLFGFHCDLEPEKKNGVDEEGYSYKRSQYNVSENETIYEIDGEKVSPTSSCVTLYKYEIIVIKDGKELIHLQQRREESIHQYVIKSYEFENDNNCEHGLELVYECELCHDTYPGHTNFHHFVNGECSYCHTKLNESGMETRALNIHLGKFYKRGQKVYVVGSMKDNDDFVQEVDGDTTSIILPTMVHEIRFVRMNEGVTSYSSNKSLIENYSSYLYYESLSKMTPEMEIGYQGEMGKNMSAFEIVPIGYCQHRYSISTYKFVDEDLGCLGGIIRKNVCQACDQVLSSTTEYNHMGSSITLASLIKEDKSLVYELREYKCDVCGETYNPCFNTYDDSFVTTWEVENPVEGHSYEVRKSEIYNVKYVRDSYSVRNPNECEVYTYVTHTLYQGEETPIVRNETLIHPEHRADQYSYTLINAEEGCTAGEHVHHWCTNCNFDEEYDLTGNRHYINKNYTETLTINDETNEEVLFTGTITKCDCHDEQYFNIQYDNFYYTTTQYAKIEYDGHYYSGNALINEDTNVIFYDHLQATYSDPNEPWRMVYSTLCRVTYNGNIVATSVSYY